MANSTITTANAGNMVVPLSAIINQLQGKLSATDLNALLLAIVGQKRNEVRPGDLITADLVNQILSNISDLEFRVAQLEAGIGAGVNQVVIFRPLPGEQFRVGQDMIIEGKNLGVLDGSSTIRINNTTVTIYRPGGMTRLTVNIPPITVGVNGQSVLLTVDNGRSSAERQIHLLPVSDLAGHVDLSWMDADPLTPQTSSSLTLQFRAKSRASLDATYLITPVISRVPNAEDWNRQLAVLLDKDGEEISSRQIPVTSGRSNIYVKIKSIPLVSGSTTPFFALSVGISAGQVRDGTGPLIFRVGSPAELLTLIFHLRMNRHDFFHQTRFTCYLRRYCTLD